MPSFETIHTGVLILGGGASGCMAAIRAREKNVEVIVIDKSTIAKSGNAGAGNKDLTCHLNEGEQWDTDDAARKWWRSGMPETNPFLDSDVIDINIRRIREVINRLEAYGVKFLRDERGRYFRSQALGTPGPYLLWFMNGHELKPKIARQVRLLGAEVFERTFVICPLVDGGKFRGVFTFSLDDGSLRVFTARAIVFSAGEAIRLYSTSQSANPWSTWHSPYNNGTAQALAYDAGARMTGLEFTKTTLHPIGFGAPGAAVFYGLGGHLLNSKGERYLKAYHPMIERAPRHIIVKATLAEIEKGRGPCYLDCRHVPIETQELMKKLQFAEFLGYKYYFEQLGIDLKRDLVQLEVGNLFATGGIMIDGRCRTSVRGLFAAGDCTQAQYGLPMALVTGLEAGEQAANYALTTDSEGEVTPKIIESVEKKLYAPIERKGGLTHVEFSSRLNAIMDRYVSWHRTEESLKQALLGIEKLEQSREELCAKNYHELMRVHESTHLLTVAKLVATGALLRRETRGSHSRDDYPMEDEKFNGHIVLKKSEDGEPRVTNSAIQ